MPAKSIAGACRFSASSSARTSRPSGRRSAVASRGSSASSASCRDCATCRRAATSSCSRRSPACGATTRGDRRHRDERPRGRGGPEPEVRHHVEPRASTSPSTRTSRRWNPTGRRSRQTSASRCSFRSSARSSSRARRTSASRRRSTALHTRTIVDPRFGAKLTGKLGRTLVGLLVADDQAAGQAGRRLRAGLRRIGEGRRRPRAAGALRRFDRSARSSRSREFSAMSSATWLVWTASSVSVRPAGCGPWR